jgi:hypothetical protein
MTVSRITKVAGASLVGFLAISVAADKLNAAASAAQVAGFVGAFLGSLAATRRTRKDAEPPTNERQRRNKENQADE